VDGGDVRMVESSKQARFARKPRAPLWIRHEMWRQDLDRDVATELHIPRAVNITHTARAERRDQPVRPVVVGHLEGSRHGVSSDRRRWRFKKPDRHRLVTEQ